MHTCPEYLICTHTHSVLFLGRWIVISFIACTFCMQFLEMFSLSYENVYKLYCNVILEHFYNK